MKTIFNKQLKTLPTIAEFKRYNENAVGYFNGCRNEYIKYMFPIITHEFMMDLSTYIKGKTVCDLMAGTGWFAYWLSKYSRQKIDAVDNKSWDDAFKRYLKSVIYMDVFEFLKNNEYDTYILSWPYMDDTAAKIWKKLKRGKYLIYIGEDCGGCTADDEFFTLTQNHEIYQDSQFLNRNFRSFDGIYDRVQVFKK